MHGTGDTDIALGLTQAGRAIERNEGVVLADISVVVLGETLAAASHDQTGGWPLLQLRVDAHRDLAEGLAERAGKTYAVSVLLADVTFEVIAGDRDLEKDGRVLPLRKAGLLGAVIVIASERGDAGAAGAEFEISSLYPSSSKVTPLTYSTPTSAAPLRSYYSIQVSMLVEISMQASTTEMRRPVAI